MFIIINADDFGLHPAINRAVKELCTIGIVTSTTVLANGPYVKDAAMLEHIGVGVHLNILRGKPISNPSEIETLVNKDGFFLGDYGKLLKRYVLGKIDISHVRLEWAKQIEVLLDLGINLTHIDSEKHIHAWPSLMSEAIWLAKKYSINWVRRPVEKTVFFRLDVGSTRTRFLNFCGLFHRRDAKVGWPDLVWGIADQAEKFLPERFMSYMLRFKKAKLIEIVCHPGKPMKGDPLLPKEFGCLRVENQWHTEFDLLSDPKWLEVIRSAGAKLVHYGQI